MFNFIHSPRRQASLLLALSSFIWLAPLHAQRTLLTAPVDEAARMVLRGNIHPLAQAEFDRGQVSDSDSTGTLVLVLGRSAAQQAALDSYVKSASMPGTSSYRQWLTPAEYGTRFGASPEDIATVTQWLESHGFTVEQVSPAGNAIRFSGNMGGVRAAFQTEIHQYETGGKMHKANATEPSIPAALAPVVRGVAALNNFHPQPHVIRGGHATFTTKPGAVRPELTIYGPGSWGPEDYDVYFLPVAGDAAIIYDTPNAAMNSAYSGTTWTGAGVTIGIASDSNLSASAIADVANYRSLFLNEPLATATTDAQLPKVVVDGNNPGVNSDELEALQDVEMAEAFAPKALTTLYTAANTDLQGGLFLAIQRAVDDNAVAILNISFGSCEQNLGAATNAFLNEIYEQAAAQGISIIVSAGDSGSAGCDTDTVGFGAAAGSGLAVNGLASTPWNVAVGGTDFDVLFTTNLSTVEQYIQVPSTSATLLGNPPYFGTANGYIPEEPWNNSTSVFTTYANNLPYKWGNGPENTLAGGGGMSSAAVCSGAISSSGYCLGTMSGYPKPAFQTALTPADSARDVPDVSFFSGTFMGDEGYSQDFNDGWSICSDNTVNGDTSTYTDCLSDTGTTACGGTCAIGQNTTTTPVGGTSTAAPAMAGVLALVIQSQGGKRLGQADYQIYNLAANYPAAFHDITAGNNSVLCTAGSTNCGSNGFMTGYNAATGYDLATGIGSLDVAKFVNDWGKVTFTSTTTTLTAGTSASSLSSSSLTVAHGATVYFKAAVSPSTATGNVVLTTSSTQKNSDSVLSASITNGMATFSTQALPGGTYILYAQYGGDTTTAGSQSQGIQVTVSPETSTTQFNINVYDAQTGNLMATSPTSAVYGSQFYADITPYGGTEGLSKGSPATGTVTLSQNGNQLATVTLDSQGAANYLFTSSTLTPGTQIFTAAYSGDASYKASNTTQSVTITKAPVTIGTIWPTNGEAFTLTQSAESADVAFNLYSKGALPTGMVTFTMNGTSIGTATISCQADTGDEMTCLADEAALSVDPAKIGAGNSATFGATYNGDGNYQASSQITSTITVAEPANAAIALSTSGNITIATPGNSGKSTLSVTPSNGFGGSVALTCTLTGGSAASYNPTCSLPASVTISGTTVQTATVSIATTAASSVSVKKPASLFPGMGGGGLALAGVLFIVLPRQRKQWLPMLVLAVMGLVLAPMGCGGGGGATTGGSGNYGTPAGTYTFTITGANGSITGSTPLTVTVQ
jgi:subtilase family serine protease